MALTKCPECSGKISKNAKVCPHCGDPISFGRKGLEDAKDTIGSIWSFLWAALGLVLLVGMCSAAFS